MLVALSRSYVSRTGAPTVDRVDTRIFTETFFSACMDCRFCFDCCCQYGATVEAPKVEQLLAGADELEAYLGVPRTQWFQDWYQEDAGYPGGRYTRTRVVDGSCVFLNRKGRGCLLHRYALEKGVPVHDVKPMACSLFPVLWDEGILQPPLEILDGTLVCLGEGQTLYRSARDDLAGYFGPDLVAELDVLEARVLAELPPRKPNRSVSLPLLPEAVSRQLQVGS